MRLLATNPQNPAFLGQNSSFEIHGLYDMSNLPMVTGQSFGIRASDRATGIGNLGNDTYTLFVGVHSVTGDIVVALRHNDFVADISTVLDAVSIQGLLGSADQIELILAKALDAAVLTASFNLYDSNHNVFATGLVGVNDVLSVYDGELYIRGGFQSTDIRPIPEPTSLALLGLGLAAISAARKRSTPG